MEVSFDQAVKTLIQTDNALADLRRWENRSYVYKLAGYEGLAFQQDLFRDRVKQFVHQHVFQVTSEEVLSVLERTEHALGDLEKRHDEQDLIEEAPWPFSFSYYLHTMIERTGGVPLWQDLWAAAWDGEFRPWYRDTLPDVVRMAAHKVRLEAVLSPEQLERGAQWRLGKYYYSALRELYLYARLRENYGIHLKYHLFADVRLFVDGWTEEGVLLCLRLRNWRENRKGTPETWMPPGFRVVRAAAAFGRRGKGWLPDDQSIEAVAGLIAHPPLGR